LIQVDAFARHFDGFSVGSNDLTQLTLGNDRDSRIVAFDFVESDPGMGQMFSLAVVGICSQAPTNDPILLASRPRGHSRPNAAPK
jgi:pyruvate, water dikinase